MSHKISLYILLLVLLSSMSSNLFATPISCETPAQLMSAKISSSDFKKICEHVVMNDPGCKEIKPEKRMTCSGGKSANELFSSSQSLEKIGSCLKGFFIDSMYEFGKFVVDLIGMIAGAAVNSVEGIISFMTDETFRNEQLKDTSDKSKLGVAFLKSSAMYFSQEFSKNLAKNPLNPMAALGETFLEPVLEMTSQAVSALAEHYIPQYQCLNGKAKIHTICYGLGSLVMPPVFIFKFLKFGVAGLKGLENEAAVEKAVSQFNSLNGISSKKSLVLKNSKLNDKERLEASKKLIGHKLTLEQEKGLLSAHAIGLSKGVYEYSKTELRQKYKVLTQAGFSKKEADELIRSGLAGSPPRSPILRVKEASNYKAAHEAIESDLFSGNIVSIERFSENDNRNSIYKVMIEGKDPFTGELRLREAIFKPRNWGDADGWSRTPMEYLAYHTNKLLDMDYVPPTAYRKGLKLEIDGHTFTEGAFIFKAPDFTPLSKLEGKVYESSHEEIISDNRVLNVLLQNIDGHSKNLGMGKHWVDGKDRAVFIDWGASLKKDTFVTMTKYPAPGNSDPVTKISLSTLEALQKMKAEDFQTLVKGDILSQEEVSSILARRDGIVTYFKQLESEAVQKGLSSEHVIIKD